MTRNPWSPEENSAGSSAGPGAATAAGLVGFSIGSETGGSIVYPCSTCGIVGLRPTYGRVSRHGAMVLSWTMDKLGPMCRGVEDCAAVFDAIRGPDGKDRSVVDAPFDWAPQMALGKLRIGYLEREFAAIQNPHVQSATAAALDVLRSLGADLQAVDTAGLPEYPWQTLRMILVVEAATAFDDATRSGELEVMQAEDQSTWPVVFRRFRLVSAVEYLRAQQVRTQLMRDVARLLAPWDVVLAPVDDDIVTMLNLTGHPEVVAPCGFVDGKPCALRFIGNLYQEATVLAVARAYEQATEWHLRHPQLESVDD
jgi:Asp-tRNA(Asn)/Glu-tRNA(Gln) amidotransferase A subunit family amidase